MLIKISSLLNDIARRLDINEPGDFGQILKTAFLTETVRKNKQNYAPFVHHPENSNRASFSHDIDIDKIPYRVITRIGLVNRSEAFL
jgi:hypothetical protein